jgi:hypothetical protein
MGLSNDQMNKLIERRKHHISLQHKKNKKAILDGYDRFGLVAEQCGDNFIEIGDTIEIKFEKTNDIIRGKLIAAGDARWLLLTEDNRVVFASGDFLSVELLELADKELCDYNDKFRKGFIKEREDKEDAYNK